MKNLFTSILLLFCIQQSFACDMCTLFDYGNLSNQTLFRLDYRQRFYKGYNQKMATDFGSTNTARQGIAAHGSIPGQENIYMNHPDDYEFFSQYNFSFTYNHKKKWNLIANLPYVVNRDFYGFVIPTIGSPTTELKKYQGIGDLSLGANRIFLKEKEKYSHIFKLGANIYLPTGKNNVRDILYDNVTMQPGRGIYATEIGANYTFQNIGLWGISLNSLTYLPFERQGLQNSYVYNFAKSTSLDAQCYKIFNGNIKKVINGGLKSEVKGKERINQFTIENSGNIQIAANIGATIQVRSLVLMANYELPFYQKLNGLQLKTKRSLSVSAIVYLKSGK
jgi:hypothetical protein